MKFNKTQYPTNTSRNNYHKKPKNSTIETPAYIAGFILKQMPTKFLSKIEHVIDIGCHTGALSKPWHDANIVCYGIDHKKAKYHSVFLHCDYLKTKSAHDRFEALKIVPGNTVVLCNPPFNNEDKTYGRKLLPELFLRKIFDDFGVKIPLILFSPMGILKNQKIASDRWKYIRDCGAKITGELELPIDAYGQGVLVHSSVLFFNIPHLPAKMFLDV